MVIEIINKLDWNKAFIVTLDSSYQKLNKKELKFENKKAKYNFDLKKEKFVYFTNDEIKTQIMILSENFANVIIDYNENTKNYKCDFYLSKQSIFNEIDTYEVKDTKNLFYRKDKSKVINVYKPINYNIDKTYNILIMFDSQNIYDLNKVGKYTKKNDSYGGWQIETSLENANMEYIVIGIENADEYREFELTNNDNTASMKKEFFNDETTRCYLDDLDAYIFETVIPFLKTKYNLRIDNFGVGGASCGGLASLYVGLKHKEQCDFIFTFTPSTGILTKQELLANFEKFELNKCDKLPFVYYFQGLNDELEKLLYSGNKYLVDLLLKTGYKQNSIYSYIEKEAKHNEDYWRYAFNYGISLLKNK